MADPRFEPKQSDSGGPLETTSLCSVIRTKMSQCIVKKTGRTSGPGQEGRVRGSFSGMITSKLDAVGINQRMGSRLVVRRCDIGWRVYSGRRCSGQKKQNAQRLEGNREHGVFANHRRLISVIETLLCKCLLCQGYWIEQLLVCV